jgi:hypothetical protein
MIGMPKLIREWKRVSAVWQLAKAMKLTFDADWTAALVTIPEMMYFGHRGHLVTMPCSVCV